MTKSQLQEQARHLRRQGRAIPEIATELGVSKSSVSLWVRDIELTPEQYAAFRERKRRNAGQQKGSAVNRERYLAQRERYQAQGRERAGQSDPLHLMGCMLYWAEGAKKRNSVYFVNSDPHMHQVFIRFLRQEFGIQASDCSIYIQTHARLADDIERIEHYWLDLLDLPASCLRKTHLKKGSEFHHHDVNNGICGLAVHRSWIVQHIYGAIQAYAGFEHPEWLA